MSSGPSDIPQEIETSSGLSQDVLISNVGFVTDPTQRPLPDAPYRGIEPFRFIDQQIFAARTDETWTLLSNVTLYRAVLLYGDSGVGKSSLINAGLLPQAIKEDFVPDRLRVQPILGREIKVERIRKSVRADAADYLQSNFMAANRDAVTESIELSVDGFRQSLEQFRPNSHPDGSSSSVAGRPAARPLLIFDQFEEFITLFEKPRRNPNEISGRLENVSAIQSSILNVLVELIQDQTLPVKIIFAFREDYLAKLYLLFDHCPDLLDQAQRLLPPHVELLPRIIRAPFVDPALRAHFLQIGVKSRSELSASFAQRISAELSLRSEGDRANLTELQIVCQRLWEAPDAEALFAQGVEEILNRYGDDVLSDFTIEGRDAAIVLLSHMITGADTRNIISEDDLLRWALHTLGDGEEQKERLRAALQLLSDSQIVRRERRRDIYFYEITSEYLVPWINKRVADRKGMVERELAAKAQKELETKRAEAETKLKNERKRLRWTQMLSAALLVLLVLVVVAVYLYLKESRGKAKAQLAQAHTAVEKETVERVLTAIKLSNSSNKQEALNGIAQLDLLIKENLIPSSLKRIVLSPVLSSADIDVRRAALKVAINAAKNDPILSQSVVSAIETDKTLVEDLSGDTAQNFQTLSDSVPTRIYIHISDESQRPEAQKVTDVLKAHNYTVPSITNVGINAPDGNQLRYFRKNEAGIPEPAKIVDLLQEATSSNWTTKYISAYEDSPSVRPGHFEVWFAASANATNGWLRAYPVDDAGTYIGELDLRFTIKSPDGKVDTKKTGYFSLVPGDYELQVTSAVYQTVSHKFTVTARKTEVFPFKLTRK
jgi:hypothetical protein